MKLETLGNDKYILLKYFYEHQELYKGDPVIITNMQTIADTLHFRKDKVIRLRDELISDELLGRYVSRGKYVVTPKGIKVIKIFSETII